MDSDSRLNIGALVINSADPVKKQSPDGSSPRRIKELDGFRGVAVLAIVFLHYVVHHLQTVPGTLPAYAQKYSMWLWIGVDAFFVLSGFLIGGILLDQRRAENYFQVFYTRRSLRIFPPYFLLLGCWCLASGLDHSRPGMSWLMEPHFPLWPYLAYVQNFWMAANQSVGPLFVAPTWSLAIEEQFYLLFPLLIRFVPVRKLPQILLGGILLAPVLRLACAILGASWETAQIRLLPTRWDSLLLGALVAWVVRCPSALGWVTIRRRVAWGILLTSGGVVALLPFLPTRPGTVLSLATAFGMHLVIAVFFAASLLLLHLGWMPKVAAALSTKFLCYFGRISYSVYLLHVPALGLIFSLLLSKNPDLAGWVDFCAMVGAFGVTVGLAQLTWWLFERRLIGLGQKLAYRTPVADQSVPR